MIGFALACKLVAAHVARKVATRAIDSHIPKSVKKASKIYSAVKTVRKIPKFS